MKKFIFTITLFSHAFIFNNNHTLSIETGDSATLYPTYEPYTSIPDSFFSPVSFTMQNLAILKECRYLLYMEVLGLGAALNGLAFLIRLIIT